MSKLMPPEQVAREARRILPHLIRGARVLAAIEDGAFSLFDAATMKPRTNLRFERPVIEALARSEYVGKKKGTEPAQYHLTDIGRAFLARAFAQESPFAEQHKVLAGGGGVRGSDTPIAWLRLRRAPDGSPFLSRAEISAAERLHNDFNLALISASPAAAWWSERIDGSRRSDYSPTQRAQTAEAARFRFWRAIDAVGPELAPVLVAAVCHQTPLDNIERALALPVRSAKNLLKAGLGALARHYGLSMEKARVHVRSAIGGPLPSEAQA